MNPIAIRRFVGTGVSDINIIDSRCWKCSTIAQRSPVAMLMNVAERIPIPIQRLVFAETTVNIIVASHMLKESKDIT